VPPPHVALHDDHALHTLQPPSESKANIGVARFFLVKYTKNVKILPNGLKIYRIAVKYSKWFKIIPTFSIICHSKALENIPKLGFLVCKYTS
jgi:hypothetical protein